MNTVLSSEQSTLVRFWGVRGSIPTPRPSTVRYGGNTACVEVRVQGEIIVLDAGSGIRLLGETLGKEFGPDPISLTLLVTHTHWDHIQGFPFFAPAYEKQNRIRILGQNSGPEALHGAFLGQMDSRYFPVSLEQMPADIVFEQFDGFEFWLGSVPVRACLTNHPGACVGYRLETPGGGVVFMPDHETGGPDEPRIVEFLRDAKVFIADAQYDTAESAARQGWGHGCVDEVVALALKAGVKQLYLFHHDPSHDDAFMDALLARARALAQQSGSLLQVDAAREGDEIRL